LAQYNKTATSLRLNQTTGTRKEKKRTSADDSFLGENTDFKDSIIQDLTNEHNISMNEALEFSKIQ